MVLLLSSIADTMSSDGSQKRRNARREARRQAQNERRALRRARNMEKKRLKALGRAAEMSDLETSESEIDPDADSEEELETEYRHQLGKIHEKTDKEKRELMQGVEKHL